MTHIIGVCYFEQNYHFKYRRSSKKNIFFACTHAKKVKVDFDASNLSSNGNLVLIDNNCGFLNDIAACIPIFMINPRYCIITTIYFVNASVRFKDASNYDFLRENSALKIMTAFLPSDYGLCS